MPATAPHRIDRYVLEHELGRGGMGVVHAAWDTRLERRVALKVLPPGLTADPTYVARFRQEMRVAAALDHPHIVPVYEAGDDFIAMRLVDGQDLRAVLEREGPLAPERAGRIARQIGGALDAAHARGLIHRDVKPANILLTGRGEDEHAYLVDFGLAREAAAHAQLTAPGEWIGTLDYAAPEQIAAVPLRPAADVYALACVAFHMLTGSPPYAGSAAHKVHAHTSDPLPSVGGPLAPVVDPLLAEATDKDPASRPASAGGFGRALDAALRGVRPAPEAVTRVAPAVAAPSSRRRPRVAAPLLLAGAGAAVVAVILAAAGGDDGTPPAARTAPAQHARRTVPAPPTTPYTAPAGGWRADLPSGDGWTVQGEQRVGAILRTVVTGPHGAQLWVDATPGVAPTFGTTGRTVTGTETYSTPAGTVRAYRFRGVPGFCAGGCLDDQLDLGGRGFAVLAGPTQAARVAARRTMRSLRPTTTTGPTTTSAASTTPATVPIPSQVPGKAKGHKKAKKDKG